MHYLSLTFFLFSIFLKFDDFAVRPCNKEAVLNFVIILFPEGKKDDVESGPEEEEVPTRGFLKRQANMIVDAKSRSKRGSRRR